MKRLIVLLSAVMILVTGCSAVKLDTADIGKNIKNLLSKKVDLYNVHFDGYKYYVPKGLKFLHKEEYNASFIDKYNNKYYLYVDAIGYYHKSDLKYNIENDIHYSNLLKFNKKDGYIRIEEIDNKFYIQFVFNYAKMEAYVKEEELSTVITNMCYVLRTVKFNDAVLESLVGENVLSYKEENFTLFNTTDSKEVYLQAAEDGYVEEEKDVFDDEDFDIDIDEDVFDE